MQYLSLHILYHVLYCIANTFSVLFILGDDYMNKRITFTIDEKLIESLREVSKESGIPQSRIVSDSVERRIEEIKELLKK